MHIGHLVPLERSNFAYVLGSSRVADERLTPLGKNVCEMLTHMHMVVYTWWCWYIYKGGRVPRVERGLGFSVLLRKLSVYFLLRRWEI